MLARIHTDHKHILTLLRVLSGKAKSLREGQEVNLTLIRDVVHYLLQYADTSHHPMEDILYRYYLEKKGVEEQISQLEVEHQSLRVATEELLDTLGMILNDAVIPREKLISDVERFVRMQTRHLEYEESKILPMLEASFNEDDWKQVDQLVASKLVEDPLFGRGSEQEFEDLRNYLADADG
ncbi:Hemerythrin-like domain-containing protein [Ferrimonas sediminum]|uniref:Hemerythrin-like domain-containing protein n=1 Tax=Ferrimonas sediminum TaxID=718193 RepID=A0A1G8ZA47_9GAMM|nr:hemerythrin domain-containing protein [Ferrimonas sediminum]SDK11949.1 Hemerythrin-like domain-containing protein [Ferrimonas sediminum]